MFKLLDFQKKLVDSIFIEFIKTDWKYLLYGLLMSLWSSFGQTFFISLFSAQIRSELTLTHGDFGAYYAFATTMSAFTILWTGKFVDSLSVNRVSIITLFFVCLSALFFSLINSILMLVIGLYLLRLSGQGMMYHVYSTVITRRYKFMRGKALAICGLGMNVAEASLPVVVIIALGFIDWRLIWVILTMIALLSLGPFIKILTQSSNKKYEDSFKKEIENKKFKSENYSFKRKDAVKDTGFWLVIIWLTVIPGFSITGIFFHQIHLSELKNIPLWLWSTNYVWYAFASISGAFISGILVDKFSAHKIAFLTQLPMLIACLILWHGEGNLLLALFFIFFGLGGGMLQPMINALLAERYGVKWLGEIKSTIWALSIFSSALSPVLMGLMIDKGSNLPELMFLLVCLSAFSATMPTIWFNFLNLVRLHQVKT